MPAPFKNESRVFGWNTDLPSDWNRSVIHTDALFFARKWRSYDISGFSPDGRNFDLSTNGSPRNLLADQKVRSEILYGQGGNYPDGEYVLKYNGTADIRIYGDAAEVSDSAGRFVANFTMTADGATAKVILEVRTPSSDFELLGFFLPGFEDDARIHPDFVSTLALGGYLRAMNLQKTNDSQVVTFATGSPADADAAAAWTSSTPSGYWSQAALPSGVHISHLVEMANLAQVDLLINIPHAANDGYVSSTGAYIETNLDAELRLGAEYSNEIWNNIFDQYSYCVTQAAAEVPPLNSDSDINGALRYQALRSQEIFALLETELSDDERLIKLAASQSEVPDRLALVVDWDPVAKTEDSLTASARFDVGMVAPYFGNDVVPTSVSQVLTEFEADSIVVQTNRTVTNAANMAARGLELWAYECGEHGTSGIVGNRQIFVDASRHAGMETVIKADADRWTAAGGGKLMLFPDTSRYENENGAAEDPWGVAERTGDLLDSGSYPPKWLGYLAWIDEQENPTMPLLRNILDYVPASGSGSSPWTEITAKQFQMPVADADGAKRLVAGIYMTPSAAGSIWPVFYWCRGGLDGVANLDDAHLLEVANMVTNNLSTLVHGAPTGFCAMAVDYFEGFSAWNGRNPASASEGIDHMGGQDLATVLAMPAAFQTVAKADTTNAALVGTSRGGMMACLAARAGFDADTVVLVNPLISLANAHYRGNAALEEVLSTVPGYANNPSKVYADRDVLSKVKELALGKRWVIIQGLRDTTVVPEDTERFAWELRKLGEEVVYVPVEDANHSFVGSDDPAEDYATIRTTLVKKAISKHLGIRAQTTVATAVS